MLPAVGVFEGDPTGLLVCVSVRVPVADPEAPEVCVRVTVPVPVPVLVTVRVAVPEVDAKALRDPDGTAERV